MHVVNVPDLVLDMETVPVGVIGVPPLVSLTVTEHVLTFPTRRLEGEQLIVTELDR